MDDSPFVGGGEPSGDLHPELDGLANGQRPAAKPFTQRLAFEQFRY
jgi:hypothetical protein